MNNVKEFVDSFIVVRIGLLCPVWPCIAGTRMGFPFIRDCRVANNRQGVSSS